MSETQAAPTSPPRKRKPLLLIVLALLTLPGLYFAPSVVIFVLLALLPSAVAYIVDKTDAAHVFKTVFCCNLSGVLPYAASLIRTQAGAAQVFVMMGDPTVWLVIFSSAALGWALIGALPLLMRFFLEWSHQREIAALRRQQSALAEEWGNLDEPES